MATVLPAAILALCILCMAPLPIQSHRFRSSMSTFADTSPKGIPVGENNMGEATPKTYPFRYEDNCYNVNKLIVAAMKEEKQGPITYRQAWDESVVCDEIMKEEKLITSQNAATWFKECESYLGIICRRECHTLSNLFDRMDYSFYPPNSENGGVDYYLTVRDCTSCLTSNDCEQTSRLTSSPYVDKMTTASSSSLDTNRDLPSLFGHRESENVFLDPEKIMIAGETTREKPLGK
jgi:hypothetical protein